MTQKKLKSEDYMFKCKECGTEYQTKPDYCDCGNDTFEEIIPVETIQKKTKPAEQQIIVETTTIKNEELTKQVKNQTNNNEKLDKQTLNLPVKPYSIAFFIVCAVLSILVIMFAFNTKQNTENLPKEIKNETTTQNIPSIDRLWNNSTEGISQYQAKAKNNTEQPTTSKKKDKITKPTKQETKKDLTQIATKPKQASQKTTPSKISSSNQSTAAAPKIQEKSQTETKANLQELASYKIKLRNHIASKISFASVVGDGTCTFSFKISSTGVLTNKAPVSLSDNDSLNEAVYNALRQIYSFSTPPKGYKNETMKLKVNMYNNSFEVYLN